MASSAAQMHRIVGGATLACLAGKTLLGPATDQVGGKRSLVFAMAATSAMLAGIATTSNATMFACMWYLVSLFYSGTWGAVASIIRTNFQRKDWAKQLGYVAASSRLGSLTSSLMFGALLDSPLGWRGVFWASALTQALVVLVFVAAWPKHGVLQSASVHGKASAPGMSQLSIQDVLRVCAANQRFWMMLIAKSLLMVVGQFIGFIPLFLASLPSVSKGRAATYSSVFALGSLVSNLLGSRFYGPLSNLRKVYVISTCLMVSVLCAGLLSGWYMKMPLGAMLFILGMWGLSWSVPFYIPPGVYALEVGGDAHAAFVTNVFDAGGFLSGALILGISLLT
jgi:predicted MFS family arabinose efflux permease